MADFFQNGVIATLQKLKERPIEELENELLSISKTRGMVLLLPALFSEFETPAMPRIIEELKGINYLKNIVLSLDRANKKQFIETIYASTEFLLYDLIELVAKNKTEI